MADFTELIHELERLKRSLGKDCPGFTTAELAKAQGISTEQAGRMIRMLCDQGVAAFIGKKNVAGIDGVTRHIPAYDLVRKKKGKKS